MVHARSAIFVGASAGGVLALARLAAQLPAAILTAQVIAADEASSIARNARMPLAFGRDGAMIECGRIYVAPVGARMTVAAPGRIRLAKRQAPSPAEPLLRSGADVYGARAIGVLLTGHAGDGTAGLAAIKRAGGIAIRQNLQTAPAADLGQPARAGDRPDYSVSLWQLPRLLHDLLIDLERDEVRVVPAQEPDGATGCTVHPWPKRWRPGEE